jgi:hypothetical protein
MEEFLNVYFAEVMQDEETAVTRTSNIFHRTREMNKSE